MTFLWSIIENSYSTSQTTKIDWYQLKLAKVESLIVWKQNIFLCKAQDNHLCVNSKNMTSQTPFEILPTNISTDRPKKLSLSQI